MVSENVLFLSKAQSSVCEWCGKRLNKTVVVIASKAWKRRVQIHTGIQAVIKSPAQVNSASTRAAAQRIGNKDWLNINDAKQRLHLTKGHKSNNETGVEYIEIHLVRDRPCNTNQNYINDLPEWLLRSR